MRKYQTPIAEPFTVDYQDYLIDPRIAELLGALPALTQQVALYLSQGWTETETAHRLQMSRTSVSRARRRLVRHLSQKQKGTSP